MNPGSEYASSGDGSSRASSNKSRFTKRTRFVPREPGQGTAPGSTKPPDPQPQGSNTAKGDPGTHAPRGANPTAHRPQSESERLAEAVRRAREANMRAHGGSDNAKATDDGPNHFEGAEPSSQFRSGHQTPPPATDDVPKRPKYSKPKSWFDSDDWARPPPSSAPEDTRTNAQSDLAQPVNDGPPSWQGLLHPPIYILKAVWSIACWFASYRSLKNLAWLFVILAAVFILPQCWLQLESLLSGFMSLLPFNIGFGGLFGSGGNAKTKVPPTTFNPPRHGGVLEGLSSQSYVLRQAHSSIFFANGGDLPPGIPLTVAANAVLATQKHFSKTIRKYEACYRDWQNDTLLGCQQLFTLNGTLVYCQGLKSERPELSWQDSIRAIFVTANPPRRSSCVADLAMTALKQGFDHRQDLSRSSECFRQVDRDLTPKRQLEDQIADLEYRLREVEPVSGTENAL